MSTIKNSEWADAIATRISDEWILKDDFSEDSKIIKKVFTKLLSDNPNECKKFIGTGIIEEDFFSTLN